MSKIERTDFDIEAEVVSPWSELSAEMRGQLDGLIHANSTLIAMQDPQDRLVYTNAAFREAFFIEEGETPLWEDMLRRNYHAKRGIVLNVPDFDAWVTTAFSRRCKVEERSFEANLHDGRWFWNVVTTQADGWVLYVGTDVTTLRTSERELRQDRDRALMASETDELTGISNRRHIMALLDTVIAGGHAKRVKEGCVCLLDIDFFKHINDEFGHQVGDQVLTGFAQLIRRTVRLADGLGRVGGEEFLLVMPGTSLEEAKEAISRIYDALRETTLIPSHPAKHVTFSAGLTTIVSGDDPNKAYKRADDALYEAKNAGRYRLHVAGE